MEDVLDDEQTRIAALAEALRSNGSIGRSEIVNRLFEFLLAQTLAGRSPKETEIAQDVFGKNAEFDMAQDASVRVHIHRLRRKLDEVYAGTSGDRLVIPRGEYRLAVRSPEAASAEELPSEPLTPDDGVNAREEEPTEGARPPRSMFRRWRAGIALALGLVIGAALGAFVWGAHGLLMTRESLAVTPPWQSFAASRRPTFLITGDFYLFGEAADKSQISRLLREFSINSRDDLDEYLMVHPSDLGRYVDVDLHYLPVSTGYAMGQILPLMNSLANTAGVGRPWVVTMSRFSPEALKGSNIVYVGFLGGLGMLRDPLFEASGFVIAPASDELIDRSSGKRYASDWEKVSDSRTPRRDFAYIASFPGPTGNRIIVVSGTRDAAVMQAAEVVSDKAQLDRIAARVGSSPNFEALYEVRTLGTLNLGSTLVLARPLKLDRLWQPGEGSERLANGKPQPEPNISGRPKP